MRAPVLCATKEERVRGLRKVAFTSIASHAANLVTATATHICCLLGRKSSYLRLITGEVACSRPLWHRSPPTTHYVARGERLMGRRRRRRRIEPTDDWEQIQLLCRWPEQVTYEEIRPLVLFGDSVAERARVTGSAERTLYRKVSCFESEGMDSLFAIERARRLALPPAMRRFIVELKAEHPPMRPNEIATVCYVRFGR